MRIIKNNINYLYRILIFSLVILFFSNCNSTEQNNYDLNLLSDSDSKTINDSIFPITFIKTKEKDRFCGNCKDVVLFASIKNQKDTVICYVTAKYTILRSIKEDVEEIWYYIFKTKSVDDSTLVLFEKDILFTIKEDMINDIHGIFDKYLLIDFGTASQNRSFQIYNLDNQKKIIDEPYFEGNLEVNTNSIFFWVSTDIKSDNICPEPQPWDKYGNHTVVVEKIKINLESLDRERMNLFECRMVE